MKQIWRKHYPEGTPEEINPDVYASVIELFEDCCRNYHDRPAYANLGKTLSFADIDHLSRDCAAWLQHGLGLKPGDRLAIMMPNLLQYPVIMFGALRAGLTIVNVNPLYTARELQHQLQDSGASAILLLENFAHTLQQVLPQTQLQHVIVTAIGDLLPAPKAWLVRTMVRHVKKMVPPWDLPGHHSFTDGLRQGRDMPLDPFPHDPEHIAFLQYTGGTTGVAKGAILTHRNVLANIEQVASTVGLALQPGREVVITALPLYHIFSLTANCLTLLRFGGLNVLITNPRDMPAFVRELRRWRFTAITGVNTLFNALMHQPGFADLDFSRLKVTIGGGMAVQQPVAERWQRITGCTISQGYGLTETAPLVSIMPVNQRHFDGSIGLPVPSTDITIRDEQDLECQIDEPGELWIRGPQVMRGYWQRPEDTKHALTEDGWFRSGDIASLREDGRLQIVDRKKDIIIVSGFNVYPNEVEEIVMEHPAVAEAACVAAPDERCGEVVKVFVVKESGQELKADTLIDWCREHLTRYKIPRHVVFRDSLPKTNVGKILRRALREA